MRLWCRNSIIIIIILSFCSCVELTAFMKLFHLVLSSARPFAIFQLYQALCSSNSVVSFLVVLGLPLFLVPWGFQSNACLYIVPCGLPSLWPIQRHFLSFICCSEGVSFVLCHNSSFEMLSGHLSFQIRLTHRFTNTWSELHIRSGIFHLSRPFKGVI